MHDSTDRRRERERERWSFFFSLSLPRGLFDIAGCSDVRVLRRHGNCLTMTPPGGARDGQKKNKSLLSIVYTSQRPYPPTTSDREREISNANIPRTRATLWTHPAVYPSEKNRNFYGFPPTHCIPKDRWLLMGRSKWTKVGIFGTRIKLFLLPLFPLAVPNVMTG